MFTIGCKVFLGDDGSQMDFLFHLVQGVMMIFGVGVRLGIMDWG